MDFVNTPLGGCVVIALLGIVCWIFDGLNDGDNDRTIH